jgi:Flp pilus assembly pilin Flp
MEYGLIAATISVMTITAVKGVGTNLKPCPGQSLAL